MLLRLNDEPDLWESLFAECGREAFHLETLDAYSVASESEPLRRFLAGEPPDNTWFDPWRSLVRYTTRRGVAIRRVRVLTEPVSDYHRWILTLNPESIEAGEDIRYLPRHNAGEPPLTEDYWLLDSSRVAFHARDSATRGRGVVVTEDPGLVGYCVEQRNRVWELATPFSEYVEHIA
ncbi:DUF6879 family protein [Nocardia sp. GTS18]|uniref:DUF6879 family protein n=1 Tax=Nocardia sp. GTS18 TaxID=1778064 RepID=UPI002105D8BE|nr:DUF6879 family protein [Nocardia sp. GTS18]